MTLRWFRWRRRDGRRVAPDEVVCIQFVEIVTDYMEGTMPAADRVRFERHLRACPHCARYLAQLRLTIDLTGRLTVGDVESLPPSARSDLFAAFRAYRGS